MQQTRPAPLSTSTALTADGLAAFDRSLLTSRSAVRRPALPHLVVRPVLVARAAAGALQAGSEQTRHRPFWGRVIRPTRCEMTTAGSERQSESCPFCGPDWRRAWPCRRDRRCRGSTAAVPGRTSTCLTGSPYSSPSQVRSRSSRTSTPSTSSGLKATAHRPSSAVSTAASST